MYKALKKFKAISYYIIKIVNLLKNNIKIAILNILSIIEIIGEGLFYLNLKLKYRFDAFHTPLPMIGINRGHSLTSGKGRGSAKKLKAILSNFPENSKTIIDIGSNNGFFSISLALKDFCVIGYEPDCELVKVAEFTSHRLKIGKVAFFNIGIDFQNIDFVPESDVSLVLSVFHRWVEMFGYNTAIKMLEIIWQKTRKAMFFELPNTIENRKIAKWMPNMGNDIQECEIFMKKMLENLNSSEVELLAFLPTDFRPNENRHLFIVRKAR